MDEQKIELLVVDDEEFNRDILEEQLVEAGYAVTLAEDGEAAWEILNSGNHNFSAVLLDRMMPRLDGMGLLKRIKSVSRFEHIPVIFQTALDNPSDIVEGMNAGAFYYLTKPVDLREVVFRLRRLVDQGSAPSTLDTSSPVSPAGDLHAYPEFARMASSIRALSTPSAHGSRPMRCGASSAMPARAPDAYAGRYAGPSGQISPQPVRPSSVSTATTVESKTDTLLPPDQA